MAVLVLALLIIGGSLYWFVLGSQRRQAVMRALGATVKQVTHLYFCLGMTLVGSGFSIGPRGRTRFVCFTSLCFYVNMQVLF